MSTLKCSISGNPLINGVVSTKTGHLYQKSTIIKQITTTGLCPHTGQPLAISDLIELKATNPTITQNYADPTKLIDKIKSQYEELVLDTYYAHKTLNEKRQQLALQLYKQDAAIRVIQKLKEEVSNNRNSIASLIAKISYAENN